MPRSLGQERQIAMINKAILMGRLTRDPEIRHTNSGTPVCSFSIAINNGYGENQTTDFINCVAWNKQAEFIERNFSKGKMIIVVGRIQTRTWEGTDGKKNYVTEVVANEVSFGESRRSSEEAGVSSERPQSTYVPSMPDDLSDEGFIPQETDDDLPF